MNIDKEREAFEKLSDIAEILNEEKSHFNGDFYSLPFNSCAESFINGAWYSWQEQAKKLEGCVVEQSQGLVLTCEEILEVLEFGAPDLKIERTEYSEEQMSTEITIVHRDTGHSGSGIYAYCTECPDEGAIKLGDVEAARGGNE
ncbi:hypothetical protein [Acinetobacter colistiniresistens]|uniref:hypothetical protein n=1 Tax=Acinetobacter colistiniresistens TaxID=280145 RepID=UPI00124FDD0E|nr:hypothetical protein [Acinetobacter colistiniresistens]